LKNNKINVTSLCILTFFLIVSTITPMVIGHEMKKSEIDEFLEYITYISSKENQTMILDYYSIISQRNVFENKISNNSIVYKKSHQTNIFPPMDSAWPLKCHDMHHTSRSQYSTADNPYDEIWSLRSEVWMDGGVVLDNNGIIYCKGSTNDLPDAIIAVYPNGTLKWCYHTEGLIWSTPAIDEEGTIYIGTYDSKLYAINPDGTRKWRCGVGGNVGCSPTIAEDGTIYVGTMSSGNSLVAVTPDGNVKWKYKTGYFITGAPCIAEDGTIYVGSADTYFYSINPNGTLRWKYKTGDYIKGPPSIADDGTIYIGSWDNYLYAFYPDGTLRWKSSIGDGTETNPSIASDGTIYVGSYDGHLYATYPNGTRRWSFKVIGDIHQSSPAISSDGTIYFGTDSPGDKGYIYAVNPDGTERWKKKIANDWVESSPCIGEDGTVYIGSSWSYPDGGDAYGYLYAFNRADLSADADGPHYGLINEPVQFNGTGFGGYRPYSWHWDFGDGDTSDEQNPSHTYTTPDSYTVTLTVTDNTSNTSMDTTFAWIQDGNNAPEIPSIDGPTNGNTETKYDYVFKSSDPEGLHIWYYIEWGDGKDTGWLGPYSSDDEIVRSHRWTEQGTYTIRCKAKDPYGDESDWDELTIEIPRNRTSSYQWFKKSFLILERLFNFYISLDDSSID
jgi:outer membrane protein assembly factor BamB